MIETVDPRDSGSSSGESRPRGIHIEPEGRAGRSMSSRACLVLIKSGVCDMAVLGQFSGAYILVLGGNIVVFLDASSMPGNVVGLPESGFFFPPSAFAGP